MEGTKSVLIYTVHKAASMFLHNLMIDLANEFGIYYYSVNSDEYYDEIKTRSWKHLSKRKEGKGIF